MESPKYPNIEVQLTGTDGNTGALMGKVTRALARNGVPSTEVDEFRKEALSGDYSHFLNTCSAWVEVF